MALVEESGFDAYDAGTIAEIGDSALNAAAVRVWTAKSCIHRITDPDIEELLR